MTMLSLRGEEVPYIPSLDISTDRHLNVLAEGQPSLCNPDLPIFAHYADIVSAIIEHSVVVISSPTGTGKSTQLPKIALEADFDLVIQTQPRRRPTINVGSRVLSELGVVLGEEKASEMVSWQTGAGLVGVRDAKIQVMTEGVLMRKEAFHPTKGTNEIWMLDEVHEQGTNQALLMGLAKQKRADNPDFTAVFMSATPDKYGLINYLTDEFGQEPALIELTAPMYNVEYRERPKSDLITEILRAAKDIHENPDAYGGSNTVQVFESGLGEINDVIDVLRTRLPAEILERATILPNHAKLSHRQQELVYQDVDGVKIIVQTNIGKTSNTVPRTRYVITQGKEKQIVLDSEGVPTLVEVDISQDDMMQQRGRGGRTSESVFIHTKREGEQYIPLDKREPHMQPEIQRVPLDDTVLYLAFMGQNIRTFDFKDEPDPKNVERAVRRMQAIGAIDAAERITDVGRKMFGFAASPEGQRCMVESLEHPERIRQYMAAIIAMSEAGGLRQFMDDNADGSSLSDETRSDMLFCLDAFVNVQGSAFSDMKETGVSIDTYLRVDELYRKLASSAGVTELAELKLPSIAERDTLRKCILAGYVNNVYIPESATKEKRLFRRAGTTLQLREISNRSVVPALTNKPVVAVPRTIQIHQKGKAVEKPIIENVTELTWQEIGRFAVGVTTWVPASLRPRGDTFVAVEHQVLGNKVIDAREVPAEPGPRLRAAVIERVKDSPGRNLLYLYKIKSETESLAHKAKRPVRRLTQDMIDTIIHEVTPDDVANPSHVEENLRQYIVGHQVSLESFVTKQERANIIANAPPRLEVGDKTLKLYYRQGKPLVYVRNNVDAYNDLPDTLQLRDGRDVLFVYDDLRLTSLQFKNRLRTQGLL